MSHQPFESWLVTEEPLNPDQRDSLIEHLRTCKTCRELEEAWGEVHRTLKLRAIAHPAPGFTKRWQARLDGLHQEQRRQIERRSTWIFLAVTLSLAFGFIAVMVIDLLSSSGSATQLVVNGITLFTSLVALISVAGELFLVLIKVAQIVIPPYWWLILTAIAGLISLAWVESLRRFVFSRRIVS